MKIVKRRNFLIALFFGFFLSVNILFAPFAVQAQGLWDLQADSGMGTESGDIGEIFQGGGGQPTDLRDLAVIIIKAILGLFGLFFVILIMIGGFRWMSSGGNEDKVKKAKSMIIASIIGAVVVIASYAITVFIIGMAEKALKNEF